VDHRARGNALAGEEFEEIIEGVAGVHHEGEIKFESEGDLRRKGLALLGFRRMLVEVVEPAFTDSDESLVTGSCQFLDGSEIVLRVVGVQTGCRVDLHCAAQVGEIERLGGALRPGSDDDETVDSRVECALERGLHLCSCIRRVVEELVLEMAVRVSPEVHWSLVIRGKSEAPFSTGPPG